MPESCSGRSSNTSPARSSSPLSRALAREYRYRAGTSSQSRIAPEPACPQTQAWASLVTGLVTPTVERSAPTSRLNSEDFPLPVPPASTTTVWLDESRIRSPARASTSSASASSFSLKPSLPLLAEPIWIILASAIRRADRSVATSAPDGADGSTARYGPPDNAPADNAPPDNAPPDNAPPDGAPARRGSADGKPGGGAIGERASDDRASAGRP